MCEGIGRKDMSDKSVEELQAELEQAVAKAKQAELSKQRLEEESKKYKSRMSEAESKLSELEKARLEEEGKLEQVLAKEREERKRMEQILNERTSSVLKEKLRAEVAKHAKDAHDVDMLLRVTEHKDLLKVDEDTLSVGGVEDFVGKVRETHGFMFQKKVLPGTETHRPGNQPPAGEGSEQEKYFAELDAAKTTDEAKAVMKKYGRLKYV